MDPYLISITIIGLASLGMAWMPRLAEKFRISYAILYVGFGALMYAIIPGLPSADPIKHPDITLHLTELVVIVSIMGTGLKIDEPFSLKTWKPAFRLAILTMLLCIGAVAFVAWYFLKIEPAAAILLGAVLAPTDPVLASDVQTGPPLQGDRDNIRFSLTAEAGMNDGMAFPFTWLALVLAAMTGETQENLILWFTRDVLYRMAAGVFIGYFMGRVLAYLVFYLPEKRKVEAIKDGFVAISATLLLYGITEMMKGYGFIAVFVTAITLRNYEMNHKYHRRLHSFTDQIERIFVAVLLLLLGGSIATGILKPLTWELAIFGLLFIFLIRPVSGLLSFIGIPIHLKEKMAISFLGIRGVGSFFYLAFALHNSQFTNERQLWAVVAFIVIASILIHGLSAGTIMKSLHGKFKPMAQTLEEQEKA